MFKTSCPRCGASEEKAELQVVYAECLLNGGVSLNEDGFSLADCNCMETTNERVHCNACGENFPLSECLDEELT